MKISFDVKYGHNTIDLPINTGEKVYANNTPIGLSDLDTDIFTIINQIPSSQTIATKTAWKKHRLVKCSKKDGIYDKSNGQMAYKANTWTAYIKDWQSYRKPLWVDGGYYTLTENDKDKYFTVNVGDLLIFADIADNAPLSIQEFNALKDKYKDCGGVITGTEVYINYKNNGEPWRTNHIEVIKA